MYVKTDSVNFNVSVIITETVQCKNISLSYYEKINLQFLKIIYIYTCVIVMDSFMCRFFYCDL